jgi:dolichol-phosphate mannosyltransferase
MTGVHDSMCGFFALRRETLLEFAPHGRGFKIAFEVLVHGGSNIRVVEQPIVFRDRARGVSKMSFGVALTFAVRWLASARIVSRRKIIAGTGVPAGSVPVGAAGAIDL